MQPRIQAQCNALGSRFLVSKPLVQVLGARPEYYLRLLKKFTLRGKVFSVELVNVQLVV